MRRNAYLCPRKTLCKNGENCVDMKKEEKLLDIKTVCECGRLLGSPTHHPLAAVVSLGRRGLGRRAVKFGCYAVLLIEDGAGGGECCGCCPCDFSYATVLFFAPGEVLRMDGDGSLARHGLLLAFDPLLLQPAALCGHVGRYSFFRYRQDEALHLSHREAGDVRRCFADIDEELRRAADDRSRTLLPRLVGLLMSYCARCYERQFITREERNRRLLGRFRLWADTWVAAGRMAAGRVPGAAECAAAVGLSEAYFCDLLLFETGRTPAEYFELRRLEAAKRLLGAGGTTPAQVARRLGFRSTDLFSQVFEKYTGQAPAAYVLN